MAEQLKAFGAPEEIVQAWTPRDIQVQDTNPDLFPVMEENWPAAQIFLASDTQWRTAGMDGTATGLDYAGVRAAAAAIDITLDADTFTRLRLMEVTALNALAERRRVLRGRR